MDGIKAVHSSMKANLSSSDKENAILEMQASFWLADTRNIAGSVNDCPGYVSRNTSCNACHEIYSSLQALFPPRQPERVRSSSDSVL